jgi:transposase
VSEWSARRKRAEKADAGAIGRAPSARTVARLLTIGREQLSKALTITVAAIERDVAALAEAQDILADFQAIIRRKALCGLDDWLNRAAGSLIAAFANGIIKDRDAV